jgi:hypothetical protein
VARVVFSESVTIAAAAITHRHALRDVVARLWKRVTKGHVHIVTFGAGGAGKSSLGTFLAGGNVADDPQYRESTKVETYRLDSATTCSVFVPPGQPSLRAPTWSDMAREVGSGRSSVVIHVVCWGLEAIEPLRYSDLSTYREGMTPEELGQAHAAARRVAEIETLRDFASQLALAPRRLSLVTVVTKQDLWWRERAAVRRHYEGPYAEAVTALRNHVGEQNFTHTLWSASLVAKNLRDGDGSLLVPTAQGYDEPTRRWHAQRLAEIVEQEVESVGR